MAATFQQDPTRDQHVTSTCTLARTRAVLVSFPELESGNETSAACTGHGRPGWIVYLRMLRRILIFSSGAVCLKLPTGNQTTLKEHSDGQTTSKMSAALD